MPFKLPTKIPSTDPYFNELKKHQARFDAEKARLAAVGKEFGPGMSGYEGMTANVKYYGYGGGGYQDALKDYKLGYAEEYAKEHKLGITGAQLLTNPQLATDPQALAKYTGKPYGGVDYTPGSADWYKLHPEEVPGADKVKAPTSFGASSYTGVSIVDYLKSVDQPSDFPSRTQLATQYGIANYTGTEKQNTQLLGILRSEGAIPSPSPLSGEGIGKGVGGGVGDIGAGADLTGLGLDEGLGAEIGVTSDEARETKRDEEQKKLEAIKIPSLTSFESDFEALRSEQGMGAIETQINSLKSLQNDLEASLREGLYDKEGKLMPMKLIGTAQRELRRQAQEEMDTLTRRTNVLVDEYNTKANVINQTMNFKAMDYDAAVNDYNMRFNQQIQLINMMENKFTREDQEADMVSDNARANLSVITKAMTDSGKIWDDLDSNTKVMVKTLEMKSGLPSGIIETFMNERPEVAIDYVTKGYDESGNEMVSFFSYNNGNPQLIKTTKTGIVKVDDVDTIGSYKEGMIADKKEGMTYKEAINAYGAKLDLDYIDRVYGKGKYTETREEKQDREIIEWENKVADKPDTYRRKESATKVKFQECYKKDFLGLCVWKTRFEYETE